MNPRKVFVACMAALSISVASADTKFAPRVELSYGFTDNIALGGGGEEIEDNMSVVDLVLEGRTLAKKNTFEFLYRPSLLRYQDISDLDRDEHRLRLSLKSQPTSKVDLDFRLDGALTQNQGDATSVNDPDLFLGRRTDREIYRGDVRLNSRINRRSSWGIGADARFERFDPIRGFDGTPDSQVEDRDSFRGTLRYRRDASQTSSLGFEYIHSIYELELSGDSRADAVLFTYTKRLSRALELDFGLGGFDTQGDSDNDQVDETGVQARFNLTRQFEKMRLRLILRREPTGGGSLAGTSINSLASIDLSGSGNRYWGWRIAPRYAHREPTDQPQAGRDSIALRAELSRRISRKIRIRLLTNHIDQSSEDPGVADRSVSHAELGLVWSLLGGSRLGGG